MSEWGVALVAAGAALAGSAVTGWYTRNAGLRQADAARHAGDRQADALLESVRMTLWAEREGRSQEARRRIYAQFLGAAEERVLAERTGRARADTDPAALERALSEVVLEGPPEVADAARRVVDALRRHPGPDELRTVVGEFAEAARRRLGP
ncbi:hypothetical protein [Streptomyces sp. NPDC058045]|uniref:hypothetical protein n=1 Tax=Streptomyces sp. NPDC058045 TaxID=3346311 RepID=UPI0036EEBA91